MKKLFITILAISFSMAVVFNPSLYPNGLQVGEKTDTTPVFVANGVQDTVTINGRLDVDELRSTGFFGYALESSIDTSATDNAAITPVGTYQLIDTHQDVAISTVNNVVTADMEIGQLVQFQTSAAARDIVFIETGNLDLGATIRPLSDPGDILILQKYSATTFREYIFVDAN